MRKNRRNRKPKATREIIMPDGRITVPPGSPKIVIHTRGGEFKYVYCDQPAKVLVVETQDDVRRATDPSGKAFRTLICPQTSVKVVGGYGTSVNHVLAMAFDDPSMDEDLRWTLDVHEIVLEGKWPDLW